MSNYNTTTNTSTYTVTDIRKTFESCEADIRTIARRTNKWAQSYVDDVMHDIIKLAENKYLTTVSIALKRKSDSYTIRATKFKVNESGSKTDSDRAGRNNDWENIDGTYLTVYLSYTNKWGNLSEREQNQFYIDNDFKVGWSATRDDTSFSHLNSGSAQLYASKGYELQKTNYK